MKPGDAVALTEKHVPVLGNYAFVELRNPANPYVYCSPPCVILKTQVAIVISISKRVTHSSIFANELYDMADELQFNHDVLIMLSNLELGWIDGMNLRVL